VQDEQATASPALGQTSLLSIAAAATRHQSYASVPVWSALDPSSLAKQQERAESANQASALVFAAAAAAVAVVVVVVLVRLPFSLAILLHDARQ
jgi:hypothetical protein